MKRRYKVVVYLVALIIWSVAFQPMVNTQFLAYQMLEEHTLVSSYSLGWFGGEVRTYQRPEGTLISAYCNVVGKYVPLVPNGTKDVEITSVSPNHKWVTLNAVTELGTQGYRVSTKSFPSSPLKLRSTPVFEPLNCGSNLCKALQVNDAGEVTGQLVDLQWGGDVVEAIWQNPDTIFLPHQTQLPNDELDSGDIEISPQIVPWSEHEETPTKTRFSPASQKRLLQAAERMEEILSQ